MQIAGTHNFRAGVGSQSFIHAVQTRGGQLETTAELQIKYINRKDLVHLEGNPRKQIDEDAVDKLKVLIEGHGFQNPLQVYKEKSGQFTILCGNHRFVAATALGIESFPCIVYEGSREMAVARAISDNKSNEWTDWDYTALKDMVCDIDTGDFSMGLTGFSEEELAALFDTGEAGELEGEDEAGEPPEEPTTKLGDMYQLGDHFLLCGDSTDKEQVDRLMGGLKADMVFTDPPYGVDYDGVNNDHLKADRLRKFLTEALKACFDVSKAGANCYVWHADIHAYETIGAFRDAGFRQAKPPTIQWVKDSLVLSQGDYHSRSEPCLYGWKEGSGRKRVEDRTQDTVWEHDRPKKADGHPTMKPLAVCERAINNSSDKGNKVLDVFGGSGSTMIACEKLKRKCHMMELDPGYCDVIVARYKNLFPEKPVCLLSGESRDATGDGSTTGLNGQAEDSKPKKKGSVKNAEPMN